MITLMKAGIELGLGWVVVSVRFSSALIYPCGPSWL